jgi:hypothetical protein
VTFQGFASRKIFLPPVALRCILARVRHLRNDHRSSVRRAKGTSESPLVDRSRFGGRRSPAHGSARCDAAGFVGGGPIGKEGWKFSAMAVFLERRRRRSTLARILVFENKIDN